MKILYIGSEPGATQVIAAALRNIAPDVAVSYTSDVEQAVTWIDENRDLTALVVEPDIDPAGWPSVLKHARRIASQPPVVVMAPEGTFRRLPDQSVAVDRQRELEAVVDLERAARIALEQKLAQAVDALKSAEQTHWSAMTATSEQLANVQTQYEIAVARSAATWEMVDEQLREAAMQVEQSRRQSASAAAEADRLARRDAELSSLLTEAKAAHTALQRQLANAEQVLKDAAARNAQEKVAAAEEFDRRARDLQAQNAQEIEHRRAIEETLERTLSARDESENRCAKLDAKLSDATTSHKNLEQRLIATETAFHDADARATRDRLTASKRAAEREAELNGQICEERDKRVRLEQAITAAEAALRDAQQRHAAEMTASAGELAERRAQFERELSEINSAREAVQESLVAAENRSHRLEADLHELGERLEHARQTTTTEIARLVEEHQETAKQLDTAREEFHDTLERLSSEHAAALGALHDSVAQRDTQLQHQAAAHETALHAAECGRVELQTDFEHRLAARATEMENLERRLAALGQEQEAARQQARGLQADMDRLRKLLDESRVESRRLFQHATMAMFRCTREGALTEGNRAFLSLVGRSEIDELNGPHFVAAVFETPKDLSWLIDRCSSTRTTESIETFWRRRDGAHLIVRLTARVIPDERMEIAVEDLTRVHSLEHRLDQSHRLEAVGRLAAEVAVTCGNLLSDVHQTAQQWLMNSSGTQASRKEGEMLLDEVTRVAGFLRQLAAYSEEQASKPALVDLNTLMRDLEPVLKRVAGESVEIQLPRNASPLNVDAGTEHVERLLVNLAAYGRQRMPFGGRLRIELGTIEVDREFTARHPNVRLGSHALITVTENRHAAKEDGLLHIRDAATSKSPVKLPQRPVVDLRTLQGLVGECGGHLWMKVQPLGDMVAKIRLPLLSSPDSTPPRAPSNDFGLRRAIARKLHH